MRTSPGPDAALAPRNRSVDTLSEQLPRLLRLITAAKNNVSESRDRAAILLLHPLARLGPLRQGALAEQLHADPSTVSRHVAVLVGKGMLVCGMLVYVLPYAGKSLHQAGVRWRGYQRAADEAS